MNSFPFVMWNATDQGHRRAVLVHRDHPDEDVAAVQAAKAFPLCQLLPFSIEHRQAAGAKPAAERPIKFGMLRIWLTLKTSRW